MKSIKLNPSGYGALLVFLLSLFIGCAVQKHLWGDAKTGFILRYRPPIDSHPAYQVSSKVNQELEIMGQSMTTTVDSHIALHIALNKKQADDFKIQVTVESSSSKMQSMQGVMEPDMSNLWGKSFSMTLTPLGREMDIKGADALTYSMGGSERNLASTFQAIFPNLANNPVKIGDAWTSRDTIVVKEGDTDLLLTIVVENRLVGLEEIDGHDCVKVTATSKGKLSGTGFQNGADLLFDGAIESQESWYFAYKEGLLVRHMSDAKTTSEIKVSGPTDMTMPMTKTTKAETKLAS